MTITLAVKTRMSRFVPSLLAVALIPAGLVAGCGSGGSASAPNASAPNASAPNASAPNASAPNASAAHGGVAPAIWAKSVCTALTPWRARLSTLTGETQAQLTSTTTPAQAKQNLVGLLSGAETASEMARKQVAAAGEPAVDQGSEIAARFVASLQAARDAYAHAGGTVENLDTGDANTFYSAVASAFEKLQHEYAASALDTDKLSSAPLKQAFNEVPECH